MTPASALADGTVWVLLVGGLTAAAAGAAAACLWFLMSAFGRALAGRRSRGRVAPGSPLPVWLRLLRPASDPLAEWLGPRIPLWARQSLHARLRRAGIDEELRPQQWVAVQLLLAAGCLAGLALAPTGAVALSVGLLAVAVQAAPWWWMRDAARRREHEVLRELPFYLDVLVLALEAGGTLSVALRAATERTPDSVLRRAFDRVQIDIRAGRSRAEALRALADRVDVPTLVPVVAALIQADASGASLAGVLRTQAEQRLAERFNAAERRALEAPVKMLGPLVLCIFPCTFVVLAFPLVMRFLGE